MEKLKQYCHIPPEVLWKASTSRSVSILGSPQPSLVSFATKKYLQNKAVITCSSPLLVLLT